MSESDYAQLIETMRHECEQLHYTWPFYIVFGKRPTAGATPQRAAHGTIQCGQPRHHVTRRAPEETMPAKERYISFHDGAWYVSETGVQLYGVISLWLQGYSPEEIQASFTPLSLQDVYGAILTYLERRDALDESFREEDARFDQLREESQAQRPAFFADMRERVGRHREAHRHGQAS
jgi:uncharacterized protein (DUF433 family)